MADEKLLPYPAHVALIMDGNGRWAQNRGRPRIFGHQAGVEAMRRVIRAAPDFSIKYLTFYAFSSENWSRPDQEVSLLMRLPIQFFDSDLPELMRNNVRLLISGRRGGVPQPTLDAIDNAVAQTAGNTGLTVIIAFNYGGRPEIVDAVRQLISDVQAGNVTPQEIDEQELQKRLYHPNVPDPDLIIRSAGELRLSNFLLWQSAYAEFAAWDGFWPDFDREVFEIILGNYRRRVRRFGGLTSI